LRYESVIGRDAAEKSFPEAEVVRVTEEVFGRI
jgi:hypothetical protein